MQIRLKQDFYMAKTFGVFLLLVTFGVLVSLRPNPYPKMSDHVRHCGYFYFLLEIELITYSYFHLCPARTCSVASTFAFSLGIHCVLTVSYYF